MKRSIIAVAGLATMLGAPSGWAQAPAPSGTIVIGPPTDITLVVRAGADGGPVLSAQEFRLALGGYYRFNFTCPDAVTDDTGFHLEMTNMMANAHLRLISIAQIEVYLQGQTFRAIECDRPGTARISFHPMRRGTYDIYVRNHATPPKEGRAKFVVE